MFYLVTGGAYNVVPRVDGSDGSDRSDGFHGSDDLDESDDSDDSIVMTLIAADALFIPNSTHHDSATTLYYLVT